MADRLVVSYSRTGTTKAVAAAVARELQCIVDESVDTRHRAGILGFLRSGNEATFRGLVRIAPRSCDPTDYDLVAIGTPAWRLSVSSPVSVLPLRRVCECPAASRDP